MHFLLCDCHIYTVFRVVNATQGCVMEWTIEDVRACVQSFTAERVVGCCIFLVLNLSPANDT